MKRYTEDFHIHTVYSDGESYPADIVKTAAKLGYETVAITDHDGIEGIDEAVKAGEEAGITVVAGIELATEMEDGTGLHILGHYIDTENKALRKAVDDLMEKRRRRNFRLIKLLNEMGYEIDEEDLKKQQPNNYIGKPVIARVLAAKGYFSDYTEAFAKGSCLESPEAKKIKKEKLNTADAINLINEAGGRAVLAHPIQTRGKGKPGSGEFYGNIEVIVEELVKAGLGGIECFHPDQNREQSLKFVEMAERFKLKVTRGSDFHGNDYTEAEATAEI